MDGMISPLWIPIIAIVGGITYAIVKSISMARVRELEVRERIAMIEKGLIPSPEADPRGFDRVMALVDRVDRGSGWSDQVDPYYRHHYRRSPARYRSAGVTLMGVGFGLMLLIGFASGEPDTAIGVGGFLVLLGIAFFINSRFERREPQRPDWEGTPGSVPPGSSQPPAPSTSDAVRRD
jgi:hypothetical protein